jgi:hypothetical protein
MKFSDSKTNTNERGLLLIVVGADAMFIIYNADNGVRNMNTQTKPLSEISRLDDSD